MKLTAHNISNVVVAIIMMTTMASCRKDLCYNHFRNAAVSLSWEQEWERDYGEGLSSKWVAEEYGGLYYDDLRPEVPEWVHLIKYGIDGSRSESFLEPDGGNLILDGDEDCGILLYNGDTEYLIVSDIASLSTARATATTRTRSSLSYMSEKYPGIRSTNPPDILYSSYISQLPEINMHESKDVPVNMQPLVFTYIIRYEFKNGTEHIALARGALAGMAESVYLLDGRTSDESAIILYDCKVTDYGCEAIVTSFGIPGFTNEYYGRHAEDPDAEESPYMLNLEIMLTNGETTEFNIDISDQIRRQPRGGVIKVTGLEIEDEKEWVDSGFEPEIIDWEERDVIEINLEVSVPKDDQ